MTRDEILKDKKWTWSIVDSPKRAPRLWALYDKLKKESPVAIQHGYPESAPSTQYWCPGFDEDRQEYDDAIAEAIDNYIKEQANNDKSYDPGYIRPRYEDILDTDNDGDVDKTDVSNIASAIVANDLGREFDTEEE